MKFKGQMTNTVMSVVFFVVLLVVGVVVFVNVYEGVPGIDQTFSDEAFGTFSNNSAALSTYTLVNTPVLNNSLVVADNVTNLLLTENVTGSPLAYNATLAQYRLNYTTGLWQLNYTNGSIVGQIVVRGTYEQQNAQADARATYTNLRSVALDAWNLAVVGAIVLAAVSIIGLLSFMKSR